jgi:DNA-binding beta-propeller fold protein YncE
VQSYRRVWSRAMPALAAFIFLLMNGAAVSHAGSSLNRAPGLLFVANEGNGSIAVYQLGAAHPTRFITAGISAPFGVAVDRKQTLYVANFGNSTVTEYSAGASQPTVTLTSGIHTPIGVAVDAADNLYVTSGNQSLGQGVVLIFPPGATNPSRMIARGISAPFSLAIDRSGVLYVGDQGSNEIVEYQPGASRPSRHFHLGRALVPWGIAIAPNGDLFVTFIKFIPRGAASPNRADAYGVLVYHPGATKPYLDIEDGLDSPVWAAVGPRGTLYVADQYKSSVFEYPPGQIHPRGVVSDGVSGPYGLAVWSR